MFYALTDKFFVQENERKEKRRRQYGEKGLNKFALRLVKAMEETTVS